MAMRRPPTALGRGLVAEEGLGVGCDVRAIACQCSSSFSSSVRLGLPSVTQARGLDPRLGARSLPPWGWPHRGCCPARAAGPPAGPVAVAIALTTAISSQPWAKQGLEKRRALRAVAAPSTSYPRPVGRGWSKSSRLGRQSLGSSAIRSWKVPNRTVGGPREFRRD